MADNLITSALPKSRPTKERAVTTPSVNRRNMLAQFGAAFAVSSVPATAHGVAADPDAELLTLARDIVAIRGQLADAYDRSMAIYDAAKAVMPSWPEVCRQLATDVPVHGLPPATDKRYPGIYTTYDLHDLKYHSAIERYAIPLEDFVRKPPSDPGMDALAVIKPGDTEVWLTRPWPEAQARIDEIVVALKAWKAHHEHVLEMSGYEVLQAEIDALQNEHSHLFERLIGQRALTVAGLQAKAIALATLYENDDRSPTPFEFGGTTDADIAVSIATDLLVMAGRPVALHNEKDT